MGDRRLAGHLSDDEEGVVRENAIGDDGHDQAEVGKLAGELMAVGVISLFHGVAVVCFITLNVVVAISAVYKIYTAKNCELCPSSSMVAVECRCRQSPKFCRRAKPATGFVCKTAFVSR